MSKDGLRNNIWGIGFALYVVINEQDSPQGPEFILLKESSWCISAASLLQGV